MPRVALVSTDPDLQADELRGTLAEHGGEPLEAVVIGLYRVADLETVDPADPWPPPPDGQVGALRRWTYDEAPTPPTARPGSARARRSQEEAAAQERGRRLWDLVREDATVVPLLDAADAVAALDPGGIRTAFHVARRHGIAVATNGLVPCLVELAARAGAQQPQSSEDSGSESVLWRPL